MKAGEYEKAARIQEEVLSIHRAFGYVKGINSALGNLAVIYMLIGEYSKCIDYAKESLGMEESIGNKLGMAADLNTLGSSYNEIGEYYKAVEMFSRSLALKIEMGDQFGAANTLSNLAWLCIKNIKPQAAMGYLLSAIDIYHKYGYKTGEETARGWLCLAVLISGPVNILTEESWAEFLKISGGDYQTLTRLIINELREKATHARKDGEKVAYAAILGDIGSLYTALGEYERAVHTQNESIAAAEACDAEKVKANSQYNKAISLANLGRVDQAIECLKNALELYKKLGISDFKDAEDMIAKLKQQDIHLPNDKKNPYLAAGKSKIGRNERCPCGSGKKFKFCCLLK